MNKLLIKKVYRFWNRLYPDTIYAGLLFLSSLLYQYISAKAVGEPSPLNGQLIGFFLLTLPIFLYFLLSENSKQKGTIGKRICKIQVEIAETKQGSSKQLFVRSFLKFLPWEIAHTGVHWVLFYSRINEQVPIWVYTLLIIPQLAIIFYFITIIITKGKGSIYDKIAGTRISLKASSL
jgi:uncharacterized RDD family membrane protein YckC